MDSEIMEWALAAGRQAHPTLRLDPEAFERHLSRVTVGVAEEQWRANSADLYLACACALRNPSAREAFEGHFLPALHSVFAQIDGPPDLGRDTLARLSAQLLGPKSALASYSGRYPLLDWLSPLAARRALDSMRQTTRQLPRSSAPN